MSEESTHKSTAGRTIPVIIVPGIMGTRLSDPITQELVWNPQGGWIGNSPGSFAANAARLQNVTEPLVPDEWNVTGYPADRAARAAGITNFFHLIPDAYDEVCFRLKEIAAPILAAKGIFLQIYGCGYDWRQGNLYSAGRLRWAVQAAREECGDEKVILIAHSQGGLVSRSFCRNFGGESAVRALFLVGSPTLGAPQAYARWKRGITSEDGVLYALGKLMFGYDAQAESRAFIRSLPSMYELLPNQVFCDAAPDWLTFDTEQTGFPYVHVPGVDDVPATFTDMSGGHENYKDIYVGIGEKASNRTVYSRYVADAAHFHQGLTIGGKAYMPADKTHCIHGTGVDTATTADLPHYGRIVANGNVNEYEWPYSLAKLAQANVAGAFESHEAPLVLKNEATGDGSVPAISGNPTGLTSSDFVTTMPISHAEHGDMCIHDGVLDWLIPSITGLDFDT